MGPLFIIGAIAAYLAVKKNPNTVGRLGTSADGRQVTEAARQTMQRIAELSVWSLPSKQILRQVARMLPADVTKEKGNGPYLRYNLLRKLPEDERDEYAENVFDDRQNEIHEDMETQTARAAVAGLMAYVSFGGSEHEPIGFYQYQMGFSDPSETLDDDTISLMQQILSKELGQPVGKSIFGPPVQRAFGLGASGGDNLGRKVRIARGTKAYVRRGHANHHELIGGHMERIGDRKSVLKEEKGVTVSVNPIAGSDLGELVASGSFDATPDEVADLLWDIDDYPHWVPRVKDTANLSKTSAKRVDHFTFAAPTGENRDIVSEMKRTGDDNKTSLRFQQKEGVGPSPKSGVTRLTLREGGWDLTATADGKTQAVYRLKADPGVSMPTKMLQKLAAGGIVDLFEAVRKELA